MSNTWTARCTYRDEKGKQCNGKVSYDLNDPDNPVVPGMVVPGMVVPGAANAIPNGPRAKTRRTKVMYLDCKPHGHMMRYEVPAEG